ncbi:hypothetical protein CP061683_0746B, partial [Chlamydia psittaci 06-1683]
SSTNAPNAVILVTTPEITLPVGNISSISFQGFELNCLTPRVIFLLSLSTERITASTILPFLKSSEG